MNFTSVYICMVFLALFCAGAAKWVGPELIMERLHFLGTFVSSVYHDPSSKLNHVVFAEQYDRGYWHFAIHDNGTLMYRTEFPNLGTSCTGIIKGDNDGKHLYMVLWTQLHDQVWTISYTKSVDGGVTWSPLFNIVKEEDVRRYFQDMVYVVETGRMFVVYVSEDLSLRVVTKPAGSDIFSQEIIIAKQGYHRDLTARAVYTMNRGNPVIHVFYKTSDGKLAYTQSSNNGLVWSASRIIADVDVSFVMNAVSNPKYSQAFYISFTMKDYPEQIIMSRNAGLTFSTPRSMTTRDTIEYQPQGLALCGNDKRSLLVSMSNALDPDGAGSYADYNFWNPQEMRPIVRASPFTEPSVKSAALDCTLDPATLEFSVVMMLTREDHTTRSTFVYFAREVDKLPF